MPVPGQSRQTWLPAGAIVYLTLLPELITLTKRAFGLKTLAVLRPPGAISGRRVGDRDV
jgi:hypothetical protein